MNKEKEERKEYSLDDFKGIIKVLRSEHGCPWDRAQTHGSLTGCMIEEAAEAVSAIKVYERTGNKESMQEELGDVLMQVVLHAQLAEEEGLFTLEDVIRGISEKMIRRHPHVFGDAQVNSTKEGLDLWNQIKAQEKAEKRRKCLDKSQ